MMTMSAISTAQLVNQNTTCKAEAKPSKYVCESYLHILLSFSFHFVIFQNFTSSSYSSHSIIKSFFIHSKFKFSLSHSRNILREIWDIHSIFCEKLRGLFFWNFFVAAFCEEIFANYFSKKFNIFIIHFKIRIWN